MAPQGTQGSGFMDLCMSLTTRFNRPTVYVDFSNIDYGVTILSGLHLMTWVGGWEWTSLAMAFRQALDPSPYPLPGTLETGGRAGSQGLGATFLTSW